MLVLFGFVFFIGVICAILFVPAFLESSKPTKDKNKSIARGRAINCNHRGNSDFQHSNM